MSEPPHRGRPYPQSGPGQHWQGGQAPSQWQGGQPPQQQWQQQWQGQQQWQPSEPHYDDTADAAELPLAPIARRAGARLIDFTLVAVFGFALILPITLGVIGLDTAGDKANTEGGVWNWPILFTLFTVLSVLPFLYEAAQLSMWGRTLGKRIMGLGVVQVRPAGEALTTYQAVWRSAINNVAYQIGVFAFLALAVMFWEYFAYGMLLVWAGAWMAYLWAIWDQPLHQSLHDRLAGTVVIDERGQYAEYDQTAEFEA
ncbi:RDD family protein [Spirillospora sp. NPDC047279]|uniref:RDD family protein n=1 Tax=Spirillospora sp. NPDC047279 TaxID=3155478 RepID=UPI00340C1972